MKGSIGERDKLGFPTLGKRPVVLVDYDPLWPAVFRSLEERVRARLGALAAAVEHVGSTAVPGLCAKPVIDMDVAVREPADLATAIVRLADLGYRHLGEMGIQGREAFREPAGPPRHNLYVCVHGNREWNRHLAFRNHLRNRPDAARAYADLKRRLAAAFSDDVDAYCEAKTDFIVSILAASDLAREDL